MLAAYVWPVLAAALLGHAAAVALARGRERGLLGALFATVGLGTAWAFSYGVPDPGSYFMAPIALALATTVALGAAVEARWPSLARGGAVVAALACLAVGPRWAAVAADRRDAFVALDGVIRGMWASIPFDEAIVLWPGDTYTLWIERQILDGEKPGIEVLNPWLLSQDAPAARFRARHGFDPRVGAPLTDDRWRRSLQERDLAATLADDLARGISARTPLPVIVADPSTLSVRLVRKP